jgi:hypothetical protein
MILMGEEGMTVMREGKIQNEECRRDRDKNVIDQNKIWEYENMVVVIGSKDEKMSVNIRFWRDPFKALKAFSLVNLRIYLETRRSHMKVSMGLTR